MNRDLRIELVCGDGQTFHSEQWTDLMVDDDLVIIKKEEAILVEVAKSRVTCLEVKYI